MGTDHHTATEIFGRRDVPQHKGNQEEGAVILKGQRQRTVHGKQKEDIQTPITMISRVRKEFLQIWAEISLLLQ